MPFATATNIEDECLTIGHEFDINIRISNKLKTIYKQHASQIQESVLRVI